MKKNSSIYHVDLVNIGGSTPYDVEKHFYSIQDACSFALEAGVIAADIFKMRITNLGVMWDYVGTYNVESDTME